MFIQPMVSGFALLDNKGGGKGCNHRDRHCNRIEEGAGHSESQPQCCNNKGKLADLSQRERGLQRQPQVLPRNHKPYRTVNDLSDNYDQGQQNNRPDILPQQGRLDQHTDRHEKDGTEKILNRGHDLFDSLGFGGSGKYGAHYKRSQCRRETNGCRQHHHSQTEAQ